MGLKPRILLVYAAALALTCPLPSAQAQTPAAPAARLSEDARLARIFADDARREDALDPLDALYRGTRPDPALLAQLYTDTLDRRALASAEQSLRALRAVPNEALAVLRDAHDDAVRVSDREAGDRRRR